MSTIQEYNCSVDLLRVLLWQDNEAVNLQALIQAQQDWIDTHNCEFWEDWFRDVFDLRTANQFGLRVWSEILNVRLFSTIPFSSDDYQSWGFDEPNENFGNGNFATDTNAEFLLTNEQRRSILRLRYYQLTSRGAIPEVNRFLAELFGPGVLYALDPGNMTIRYIFAQSFNSELRRLITELDLLPRPAGVRIEYADLTVRAWGFNPQSQNFDNGNFITTGI